MQKLKYFLAKMLKRLLRPAALINCKIDKTAAVCSGSELSSVKMSRYSYIGNNCFIVNAKIGAFCSIADKCSIGGAAHPLQRVSTSPVFHSGKNIMHKNFADFQRIKTPLTVIENDVWIGMGAYIKAGVTVHNGAVIGMGSVVTKDIPAYEIWAGNPAKKIGQRFDQETVAALEKTEWWNWNDSTISSKAALFDDVGEFIKENRV